jgi:hypothetical protein
MVSAARLFGLVKLAALPYPDVVLFNRQRQGMGLEKHPKVS